MNVTYSHGDLIANGRTRVLLAVLGGATMLPEVMAATGLGKITVWKHLQSLKAAGLIAIRRGHQRSIRPLVGVVR